MEKFDVNENDVPEINSPEEISITSPISEHYTEDEEESEHDNESGDGSDNRDEP